MPRKTESTQIGICLFRGINVGGNKIVRMEELRALFERLGYTGAKTYIQSGNVVFRFAGEAAAVERRIGKELAKAFGFEAAIMVRSLADWRAAIEANPFPASKHATNKLALHVLSEAPDAARLKLLDAIAVEGEKWRCKGAWLYVYFAHGTGTSKLAAGIERQLKVSGTARNWNTVLKLLEIAEALEGE